ncbi:hypothetical protein [Legionella sp. km772]|uniref:hypothetical protein n=1 Tax=Legionella sp. km772 TaxID=2498111 RepID=UPI0013155671|nr:hypothetical protein [Legionella sp. km772]
MMKKLCLVALCLVSFSMNSFACGCNANKNDATKATSEQKCTCDKANSTCDKCAAKSS